MNNETFFNYIKRHLNDKSNKVHNYERGTTMGTDPREGEAHISPQTSKKHEVVLKYR